MLDWSDNVYWLVFGLLGNATFAARFLVQWIASERAGESVMPVAFWYLSIVGSLILLAYALHLGNPVFTLAYLPNGFIYARNLTLLRRKERELDHERSRRSAAEAALEDAAGPKGPPV